MEAYKHSLEQTYLFLTWLNQSMESVVVDSYIRAISKGLDFRLKMRSNRLPLCDMNMDVAIKFLALYVQEQKLQNTPLYLVVKDLDLMVDISYYKSMKERLLEIYVKLKL